MNLEIKRPLITQIEEMVKDIPGWTPVDQLYTLYTLAILTDHLEGDIIEIGSWCGRSSVVLASTLKKLGKGKLHCIDLFPEQEDWYKVNEQGYSFKVKIEGSYYASTGIAYSETYHSSILPVYETHSSVFRTFLKNLELFHLTDYVDGFRGNSLLALEKTYIKNACRLAFLDGDHNFEPVCRDIEFIENYLVSGGVICFDYAFSSYEGVGQAIQEKIINSGRYSFYHQMNRKFFIAQKK